MNPSCSGEALNSLLLKCGPLSALCTFGLPYLVYMVARAGRTSLAIVDLTSLASGKRERLHHTTRIWEASGKGPNRSNKSDSHRCAGVGELDKGVWKGLLVWIWHSRHASRCCLTVVSRLGNQMWALTWCLMASQFVWDPEWANDIASSYREVGSRIWLPLYRMPSAPIEGSLKILWKLFRVE